MKYILVMTLGLLAVSSVYAQTSESSWPATPVTIDGNASEWPSSFRFFLSAAIQFDLCNDSSNLYICVKSADAEAQSRFLRGGLTIWLDETAKKKQKTSLVFPTPLDYIPQDQAEYRATVKEAETKIKVSGIAGVAEDMIPLQNKSGIEIAWAWDSNNALHIEYKIPLAIIYRHPVTSSDLQHPISLGLVSGAVDGPKTVVTESRSSLATKTVSLSDGMRHTVSDPKDMAQTVWLKLALAKSR